MLHLIPALFHKKVWTSVPWHRASYGFNCTKNAYLQLLSVPAPKRYGHHVVRHPDWVDRRLSHGDFQDIDRLWNSQGIGGTCLSSNEHACALASNAWSFVCGLDAD